MKFLRFGPAGQEKPGALDANGHIRDLSPVMGDLTPSTIGALGGLSASMLDELPIVAGDVRLGPCVAGIGKFVCIGLNYADHAAETGTPIPAEPIIFMKATSAVCGSNDDVFIPPGSTKTDWEVELGVVIGRTARHVPVSEAASHVAGYCVVNDVSEREYQMDAAAPGTRARDTTRSAPSGPGS